MTAPPPTARSPRAVQIVAVARKLLETEGRDAVTMRRIADELGIRAPSIYKHFADKAGVESALVEQALVEVGTALHAAVEKPGRRGAVASLLSAYRAAGVASPNLYRLATSGPIDRGALAPGVEEWAGEPFYLATRDPHRAQALWAFAHGMVILEIDGRFLPASDLDRTWRTGIASFAHPSA